MRFEEVELELSQLDFFEGQSKILAYLTYTCQHSCYLLSSLSVSLSMFDGKEEVMMVVPAGQMTKVEGQTMPTLA